MSIQYVDSLYKKNWLLNDIPGVLQRVKKKADERCLYSVRVLKFVGAATEGWS